MLRRLFQKVRNILEALLYAGRFWGYARLLIVISLCTLFVYLGRWVYGDYSLSPFKVFLTPNLHFLVFPLAAIIGALLVAANYIRDIYELPELKHGLNHMFATLFGMSHARLRIEEGEKKLAAGEVNLLDKVGGPGYVNVAQGSAVLLERLTSPSNVYGAGIHYVTHLETVRQTANLEDQHGFVEETFATTKDGVRVVVRDIHYRYRLRAGRQYGDYTPRTPETPYPFTVQALRNLAYNRVVRKDGLTPLNEAVQLGVNSFISEFIQSHQIDYLIAPPSHKDPREEIEGQLFSKPARERFWMNGVELLWVDIGHFGVADKIVGDQHVEAWATKWSGRAMVVRKYGEAVSLEQREMGRAKAQADILSVILDGLQQAAPAGATASNVGEIVLLRTAQMLEAYTEKRLGDNEESSQQSNKQGD